MNDNHEFELFARELEQKLIRSDKPLTVRDLQAMTWHSAQKFDRYLVSKAVHWLHQRGVPVTSGQMGYWYAMRAFELDPTIADLLRRKAGLEEAIEDVRTIRRVLSEREKAQAQLSIFEASAA